MPTKLVVPGVEVDAQPDEADAKTQKEFGVTIATHWAVRVGAAIRGKDAEPTFSVADDEQDLVAELEFEDGIRQWVSVNTLRERLEQTERGDVATGVIRIPVTGYGAGTRGAGELALKGFKLLDIVLPAELTEPVAGPAARAIAAYYEDRLKPEPGLYALDRQGNLAQLPNEDPLPPSNDPYLALLHGTFSTTGGSFGRLIHSAEWMELCDAYPTRIVGWNHRTLSESPAQNTRSSSNACPTGHACTCSPTRAAG